MGFPPCSWSPGRWSQRRCEQETTATLTGTGASFLLGTVADAAAEEGFATARAVIIIRPTVWLDPAIALVIAFTVSFLLRDVGLEDALVSVWAPRGRPARGRFAFRDSGPHLNVRLGGGHHLGVAGGALYAVDEDGVHQD